MNCYISCLWRLVVSVLLLISLTGLFGCGDNQSLPANYVGTFKSIRTNNDTDVVIVVTEDTGTTYKGTISSFPVEGEWGKNVADPVGGSIYQYMMSKGADTNFIDFYLVIGGSELSGTVLRQ